MKATLLTFLLLCLSLAVQAFPITFTNSGTGAVTVYVPGVSNPEVAAGSNVQLDVEEGQKVFFMANNRRYLLLIVDASHNGQTLDLATLIQQRKTAIGIQ